MSADASPGPGEAVRSWGTGLRVDSRLAVAGVAVLLTVPFVDQAFHVDDPNFLALAAHAWPHPLELYDFTINWGGTDERAFDILANPPLVPWLLAVLSALAGGREWCFHVGFWPFLALALAGAGRLVRRFTPAGASSAWPLLFIAVSPALVIASHTVMPDLPLLAFYTLGLALAIDGIDRRHAPLAISGALLAGASALCRYSGMTTIPLLGLYLVLHRTPWKIALGVMAAVLAPIAIWSWVSLEVYGRVHWLAMAGFEGQSLGLPSLAHKLLYQVSALGLVVAPAASISRLLAARPGGGGSLGLLAGASGAVALAWQEALPWTAGLLLILGLALGGMLVGTALQAAGAVFRARVRRRHGGPDADAVFLAAWLLGMLVFNLWLLFASVRYLLPALPPAVLLLTRTLPAARDDRLSGHIGATLVVFALSLGLSVADYQHADAYRAYVHSLPPIQGRRWFSGHWGLQYYLEQAGARALSSEDRTSPRPGDELIAPAYAWPQDAPAGLELELISRTPVAGTPGLRTFTVEGRGCFYADILSPGPTPVWLPFGFSRAPLETLSRFRVAR